MKVLNDFVVVQKQKDEYQGLIQGVDTEDATKAKVLGVGEYVDGLLLNDIILLDWKEAKRIKNELYAIKYEHIVMVLEENDQEI